MAAFSQTDPSQDPTQSPRRQGKNPQAVNNGWQPSQFQPGVVSQQQDSTGGLGSGGPNSQNGGPAMFDPSGGPAMYPGNGDPSVKTPPYISGGQRHGGWGGGNANLSQLSSQLAQQAASYAKPNVAGQKASSVDLLSHQRQNSIDQARMSAASRGASLSSPFESNLENQIQDQYSGNLANSYNQIDQNAQQTGLNNILGALGGVTSLNNSNINNQVSLGNLGINQATSTAQQQNQFLQMLLNLFGGS